MYAPSDNFRERTVVRGECMAGPNAWSVPLKHNPLFPDPGYIVGVKFSVSEDMYVTIKDE